jgi:hypothetical protein
MSKQRISLVQHYADREGMGYEEALSLLVEEAGSHDNAQEFLDEIGFEPDYLWDARYLMDEAQA